MPKVENIRLASVGASHGVELSLSRHAPELLDVLASGEPAAFATDSRERIVFWNRGAAALLGRHADDAMGRHCYEVIGGRDVFGNRFCYANCPLAAMNRSGEAPGPFEIRVPKAGSAANGHTNGNGHATGSATANGNGNGAGNANGNGHALALAAACTEDTIHVTVIRMPGPRPDLFTLVHVLHRVDEQERLARALARFAPAIVPAVAASAAPTASASCAASAAAAASAREPGETPRVAPVGPEALTPREREILHWIAAGLQNKEIAQRLSLSLATVRNHIHNTLEKLEVHSKLEAVSLAYRNGWVGPESAGADR